MPSGIRSKPPAVRVAKRLARAMLRTMLALAVSRLCVARAEEMEGELLDCAFDSDCTSGICNIYFWDYSSRELDREDQVVRHRYVAPCHV
jgi:hypothetical protein